MVKLLFKAYDRMKAVAAISDGKIYIRGAGKQGNLLKEELELMGIPIAGFLDINAGLTGDWIFHPDYAYNFPADKIFIACSMASPEAYAAARLDMAEHGLKECVHFADFGVNCDGRMLRDFASSANYRSFVGYEDQYDIIAAMQFNLLTSLGLRQYHKLLDLGCGSLRAGRLFIPYLNPSNYFGIEPERWLIEEGIHNELGSDILNIKKPKFIHGYDFPVSHFGEIFDYVIAHSIFSHANKDQIAQCLKNVQSCLAVNGLFIATFVSGDEDYEGEKWVYPVNCTYTEQTIRQMANAANLTLIKLIAPCAPPPFATHPSAHPSRQTWVVFVQADRAKMDTTPEYK